MLTYIIKVSLCWLGFYLIYTFFLSKETFFRTNRWYLLATLLLGAVIPLLEFLPIFQEDNVVVTYVQPLNESVYYVQATVNKVVTTASFDWMALFWAVYITGMGLCAIRFGGGLWKIYQMYAKSEVSNYRNYKLVKTNEVHLPFTFFNYLFWSDSLKLNDEDGQKIITHEEAHVNGWHSIDVMFMEIINIIFWISPMVYFYKKSIRTVHEYLADAVVLQTTPTKKYGHLLLKQSQSGLQVALANHFIHSQLKQRIVMMTRNKSSRQAMVKYLFALPVILLLFILFSKKEIQAQTNQSNANELEQITIVAHGTPQSEATTTDPFKAFDALELIDDSNITVNFDRAKVKAALRAIASRYDKNASKEYNEKVRNEFNKLMRTTYKKHYAHRTEVFKVVDELVKEYNIGWAQESSNANGVRMIDWPSKEYLEQTKKDARAFGKEHLPIGGEMLKDNPLFVVDGIVKWRSTKSPVSIEEIFSVNILKEKAATDKYGWEAVNGVLEIVTHKGKKRDYRVIEDASFKVSEQDEASKKIRKTLANGKDAHVSLESLIPSDIKDPIVYVDGKKITSKDPMYFTVGKIKEVKVMGGQDGNNDEVHITLDKDFKPTKEEGRKEYRVVTTHEKNGDKTHFMVDESKLVKKEVGADPVFKVVQEMPRFYAEKCESEVEDINEKKKCAEMAMLNFIYTNIKYPAAARKEGIQGKVIVQFIIEKDGSVSEIKLIRDIGGGAGEEAVRVMESSPKWVPGKQKGENVRVQYTLPVRFKLEGDSKKEKPLIVIDGVVHEGVDIKDKDFLDPNDIATIDVLKGEAAVKKYGDAGKDGVIEIITKNNKSSLKASTSTEYYINGKKTTKKVFLAIPKEDIIEIKEDGMEISRNGKTTKVLTTMNAITKVNSNSTSNFKLEEVPVGDGSNNTKTVWKELTPQEAGFTYVKISPNPTDGKINIEYGSKDEKLSVIGTDINGKEIFNYNLEGGRSSINDVDISKAAKGIVLVTFRQGKNVYTEKVILQ